jgi:hypothetical protein
MPMLQNQGVPNVPLAPREYDQAYMNALSNVLRLFFNQINAVQQLNLASLNFSLDTLPTQLDFNTLRLGDVYRDTVDGIQDGSQMLRIKTSANVVFLAGTSSRGTVGSVVASRSVALTGVAASGVVGSVTITSVSGSGAVGSVGVDTSVAVTGVSGSGSVGTVIAVP